MRAMPALLDEYHTTGSTENQIPNFNPDTLQNLTEHIASNLKSQGKGPTLKNTAAGSRTEPSKSNKELVEYAIPAASNGTAAKANQKPSVALKPSQAKKRSRDGRIKERSDRTKGKNVILSIPETSKPQSSKKSIRSGFDNNIDEEIRALGGTKEDVDLIANLMSDSEIEDEEARSRNELGDGLEKEVLRLVRQLGVDRVPQEVVMANSQFEEAEEVEKLEDIRNSNLTTSFSRGQSSLILQPRSEWLAVELPPLHISVQETFALSSSLLERLHNHAKALLEHENMYYAKSNRSASSAQQFYSTIMSTGTLSDKVSALTLSVQESPVHNMRALESLVGLARKRSRGQAVEVLGALKDLFGPGNLLPSDRKLKSFASQPALSNAFTPKNSHWTSREPLPRGIKEIHLILWAYEDWLKMTFFEVLKIIETWCNDEIVFARGKAVDYVCELLKEKPEQEANLLRLLVNKLGDTDKKIASKASFNILQLEAAHPLMKPTIIAAIESDLLFRPSQSLHAKYYASITLNQTVLSRKESGVARKLLDIYFSLFIKLLDQSEMAKPAATRANVVSINKKGEVQGGGGSAGKKALKKLGQEEKSTTVDEDLREKMLSAVLAGVNRAIPFTDTNDELFERQMDTLYRVAHSSNFNTSIQALILIQQLNGSHQGSMDRFYRTLYESLLDPRLLTSSKQALYLNLMFRALRSDLNVKRVKAFAKRLLQVAAAHQPSFICATLYLLRELEGVFANPEAFIGCEGEDSDGEEDFRDVQEQPPNGTTSDQESSSKIIHRLVAKYDGRRRDPQYSDADKSSLWEAVPLMQHYHPSVALFATRLLTHDEMPPKPDLSFNTLIHFLDRFVYRNPKVTKSPRGASIMQPMAGGDSSALLVSAYSDKSSMQQPVNSEAFWKQASDKVNADEAFFHKYFSTLGRGKAKTSKKKTDRIVSADENEDDADEDEIWDALVETRPEVDEESNSGFGDEDMESDTEEIADGKLEREIARTNESIVDNLAEDSEGLSDLDIGDDEALLSINDEVPSDLGEAFDKQLASDKANSVAESESRKRGSKRRKLKSLPTFASADDYAKILEEDDDD